MNLYKNIFQIIASPKAAWENIKKYNIPKDYLMSKTFYPLLAILAVSVFVRYFYGEELSLSEYLTMSIISVCKYFFGYLISVYFLSVIFADMLKENENKLHVFLIYNYCILMIINIISFLIPSGVPILHFFPIYIVYVIFKSLDYFNVPRNEDVKYVIYFSLFTILPSVLIEKIFNVLI